MLSSLTSFRQVTRGPPPLRRPLRRLLVLSLLSSTWRFTPAFANEKVPWSTPRRRSTALFASSSRVEDMVAWLGENRAALRGASFLASADLAEKLSHDPRLVDLNIQTISGMVGQAVDDIRIAGQVLAGEIAGIVCFQDGTSEVNRADVGLLIRASAAAHVPLALNEATADLVLKGVLRTRTAYLIFNPIAGQGDAEDDLALIRSLLEPQIALHVVYTQKDRETAVQAQEIVNMIKASPDFPDIASSIMVLASGGDGTVSAIAGATMGSGIPFGVIPRGTANGFAVALNIPTELEEACLNIVNGNIRVVDGAMCNDMPMVLLGGIGWEAGMVENASRELKDAIGPLAYIFGGAEQLFTQELFKCKVIIDGKAQEIEASGITVANVAPGASVSAQGFGEVTPDDGLLDVTISTANSLISGITALGSLLASAVVKTPTKHGSLVCSRAKSITLDCDPPQKIVVDGELIEMNPITFKSVPKGLHVIAPEPADEE